MYETIFNVLLVDISRHLQDLNRTQQPSKQYIAFVGYEMICFLTRW